MVPEIAGEDDDRTNKMSRRWNELILEDGCNLFGIVRACMGDVSVISDMMWGEYTRLTFGTLRADEIGVGDHYWLVPNYWESDEVELKAIAPPPPPPPPSPRPNRSPRRGSRGFDADSQVVPPYRGLVGGMVGCVGDLVGVIDCEPDTSVRSPEQEPD